MAEFKYQMHCHTSPCSHCGRINPYDLIRGLHEAGYAGCVLTNHFYNGNCGIDRELPWKKFISFYEKDYLECCKAAEKYGLNILFGIEEHVGSGKEILCYGLTPEMLYSHPELKEKSPEIWYKTLSALGVIIIQAHPFRQRSYMPDFGPLPEQFVDGIEVFNFGNLPEENELAEKYAATRNNFILTSGADAHLSHVLSHGGIITDKRIITSEELASILRNGEYSLIKE